MRTLVLIPLLFTLALQDGKYKITATIPVTEKTTILTDNLNSFYLLSSGTLSKYSPYGKKIVSFSEGSLGDITSADVTNPNRILLFYDNFNQILILNNALNIAAEPILLDSYKLFSVKAIATSPDEGFFLFDEATYTVRHFNQSLKEDYSSIPLYTYLQQQTDSMQLFFRANRLFLFQPGTGLLIFDEIGNFLMQVKLPGEPRIITVGQDALFYKSKTGDCIVFALTSGQSSLLNISQCDEVNSFVQTNTQTITVTNSEVRIFKKI